MKKNKSGLFILGVILLLAVFSVWNRSNNPEFKAVAVWKDASLTCIDEGVTTIAQHNHPQLRIYAEGAEEFIPAHIGLMKSCTSELHTHEDMPNIHVESAFADKVFKLGQFFAVWGKSIERAGYKIEMTVDGQASAELGELVLKDKQQIILNYRL